MSENKSYNRIIIYLIGDSDMMEGYFQPVSNALRSRFEAEQISVIVRTIHAYGGNDSTLKQWLLARRDMQLFPEQIEQSVGGQKVRQQVKILGAKEPILFIGHGAGGVAAYHAAELLEKHEACNIRFIVQINSPKSPISPSFSDRVGYIARNGVGVEGEPSPWQGGWSHQKYRFASHRYPGLLFNSQEKGRRFYAPKNIVKLDIKGPSNSYFSSIQGHGAVSNLAKTLNVIWNWFSAAISAK
jgi:hypothetical protein